MALVDHSIGRCTVVGSVHEQAGIEHEEHTFYIADVEPVQLARLEPDDFQRRMPLFAASSSCVRLARRRSSRTKRATA